MKEGLKTCSRDCEARESTRARERKQECGRECKKSVGESARRVQEERKKSEGKKREHNIGLDWGEHNRGLDWVRAREDLTGCVRETAQERLCKRHVFQIANPNLLSQHFQYNTAICSPLLHTREFVVGCHMGR